MLYSFTKQDKLGQLPVLNGLEVRENDDPMFMSVLGEISVEQASIRLANDNKAFVAYFNNVPAAFGWVAMGKARIGELNHEFILPPKHRYLWNFRTLPEFRGLGIYPLLLQHILTTEQNKSDCLWIMHAPENKASQRGITKAGFRLVGKVSVVNGNEVIFDSEGNSVELNDVLDTFGFTKSDEPQATCWNCSSPYLLNRKATCCCSTNNEECSQRLFVKA